MTVRERVIGGFEKLFGGRPAFLVRAPGRVNLIGEHTDYNDGFVLPMAMERAVWIALRPRDDRRVRVRSLDFDGTAEIDLDDLHRGDPAWAEYVRGVAWSLQEEGFDLCGWEGVTAGDVPIGAGLSSSAALELAAARAFASASGLEWDPRRMALLSQRAENRWVGMNCGIMDQLIAAQGEPGHALLIDCRSLDSRPVPLPPGTEAVVLDTGTRRGLTGSAYNERRARCEEAARLFGVRALRDVDEEEFRRREGDLDETARRRARHVITENARTLRAAEAMSGGDPREAGRLMDMSHASLRDDFEVSSPELDAIVEITRRLDGCYGAREAAGEAGRG